MGNYRWTPVSGGWYMLDGQMDLQAPSLLTPAVNEVFCCPFWGKRGLTIDQISYEITTQGVSASGTDELRIGIYNSHASTGGPDTVLADFGKVDLEATVGVKTFDVTNTVLEPKLYWLATVRQTTGTIGTPAQVRGLLAATRDLGLFNETASPPTMGASNLVGKYAYSAVPVSGAFATFNPANFGIGTAMPWIKYKAL